MRRALVVVACLGFLSACGGGSPVGPSPTPPPPSPSLSRVQFLAFGDSITTGVLADGSRALNPYPVRLEALLAARYGAQHPSVIDGGLPGEAAVDGQHRLPTMIGGLGTEVVLILEGACDISGYGSLAPGQVGNAISAMVSEARRQSVDVLVATLPPQRAGHRGGAEALVLAVNERIAAAVSAGGGVLVDVHGALAGDVARYISDDGLHPTEDGYAKIAETFFAAIVARFEQ